MVAFLLQIYGKVKPSTLEKKGNIHSQPQSVLVLAEDAEIYEAIELVEDEIEPGLIEAQELHRNLKGFLKPFDYNQYEQELMDLEINVAMIDMDKILSGDIVALNFAKSIRVELGGLQQALLGWQELIDEKREKNRGQASNISYAKDISDFIDGHLIPAPNENYVVSNVYNRLYSSNIRSIKFNSDFVQELAHLDNNDQNKVFELLLALRNGIVAPTGQAGIKRPGGGGIHKDFVEIKNISSNGHNRLYGCLKSGVLIIKKIKLNCPECHIDPKATRQLCKG